MTRKATTRYPKLKRRASDYLHPDHPVGQAIRLFRAKGLRYIPVVDEDDKLVGILGRRDILRYYLDTVGAGAVRP